MACTEEIHTILDVKALAISNPQQTPEDQDREDVEPGNPADNNAELGSLIDDKHDPASGLSSKSSGSPPIPVKSSPRPIGLHLVHSNSDLHLHSPSINIIGTPFDVTSPRFEYPFPAADESTSESAHPLSASMPSLSSSLLLSNPLASSSCQLLLSPSFTLPSLPQNTSYSTTHPKLRSSAGQQPPVPPGLVKKRHRLTLELMSRHASDTSVNSSTTDLSKVDPVESVAGRHRSAAPQNPHGASGITPGCGSESSTSSNGE